MTQFSEAAALAIAEQLWKPGRAPTPQGVAKLLLAVARDPRAVAVTVEETTCVLSRDDMRVVEALNRVFDRQKQIGDYLQEITHWVGKLRTYADAQELHDVVEVISKRAACKHESPRMLGGAPIRWWCANCGALSNNIGEWEHPGRAAIEAPA